MTTSSRNDTSFTLARALRVLIERASQWAIWVVLAIAVLVGASLSSVFLTKPNLLNLLSQSAVLGIAAIGVTFVMLVGEIDVSIAGIATVGAVMGAGIMNGQDSKIWLAIVATVAFGAVVGLINGLLVSFGVQSFILTLAVGTVLLASGALYTGGAPIGFVAPKFSDFFLVNRLGIPTPVWSLFVVLLVAYAVQTFTRLGHRVFLVGGNPAAAHLSGISVRGTIVGTFVLSGACAGLAGLVLLGRTGVPNDFSGLNLHFQALAAVALGGTAFAGGRGSVIGTFAGVLLIVVSLQIGILLGWPYGAQLLEYGVLILVALVVYSVLKGEPD